MAIADFSKSIFDRYPQLEKISPQNLMEQFETLPPRERSMILIAAACIAGLLFYFVVTNGLRKLNTLQGQVDSAHRILAEIQSQASVIGEQMNHINRIRSRIQSTQGFYLASFVEGEIKRFNLPLQTLSPENRIDLGGGYEEVSVDVVIGRLSYTKLLNLLTELENNTTTLIRIKRFRIKSVPGDPVALELDFRVSAYARK